MALAHSKTCSIEVTMLLDAMVQMGQHQAPACKIAHVQPVKDASHSACNLAGHDCCSRGLRRSAPCLACL